MSREPRSPYLLPPRRISVYSTTGFTRFESRTKFAIRLAQQRMPSPRRQPTTIPPSKLAPITSRGHAVVIGRHVHALVRKPLEIHGLARKIQLEAKATRPV